LVLIVEFLQGKRAHLLFIAILPIAAPIFLSILLFLLILLHHLLEKIVDHAFCHFDELLLQGIFGHLFVGLEHSGDLLRSLPLGTGQHTFAFFVYLVALFVPILFDVLT